MKYHGLAYYIDEVWKIQLKLIILLKMGSLVLSIHINICERIPKLNYSKAEFLRQLYTQECWMLLVKQMEYNK